MRFSIGLRGFGRWLRRTSGIRTILSMRLGSHTLAIDSLGHARYLVSVQTRLRDGRLLSTSRWSLPISARQSVRWRNDHRDNRARRRAAKDGAPLVGSSRRRQDNVLRYSPREEAVVVVRGPGARVDNGPWRREGDAT